jgi:hypothetical protein
VCLFGSHVPLELVLRCLPDFKSFAIWLDPDKKKEAVLQALKLKSKGIDIRAIITEDKDPKHLTNGEIHNAITNRG